MITSLDLNPHRFFLRDFLVKRHQNSGMRWRWVKYDTQPRSKGVTRLDLHLNMEIKPTKNIMKNEYLPWFDFLELPLSKKKMVGTICSPYQISKYLKCSTCRVLHINLLQHISVQYTVVIRSDMTYTHNTTRVRLELDKVHGFWSQDFQEHGFNIGGILTAVTPLQPAVWNPWWPFSGAMDYF